MLAKHGVDIRSILMHEGLIEKSEKFKLQYFSTNEVNKILTEALKYIDFVERE